MKKRILFFAGGAYISGLEIVTLHLIRKLKSEGHELKCVINGWNDGMFIRELEKVGVPYEEAKLGWLYFRKPLWTLDSLVHLPKAYFKSRRIIREFDPDVIHYCNYATVILLYPLLRNRPGVYNLQEPHEPNRKNLTIYRLLNKRVNVFTGVSEYIGGVLTRLGIPKQKISLVYNGVPPIPDPPVKPEEEKLVFGIIGQVASWKGHETLIEAIHLLQGASRPFVVKIFGNDKNAYAEELRKKIAEKKISAYFEWEGFVREQKAIYDKVDVVVVPSLSQEPCSLTIIESMMYGKRLIVSDRGGNPELVEHRRTGLIFPAEDARQLMECLRLYLEKDAGTASIPAQAHDRAMHCFTDDRMTAVYTEIYSKL
ncbi:MAG TPA: glycosyltransferase [Puia sp.]|nr:glycosyltransferase [Puia sp.]